MCLKKTARLREVRGKLVLNSLEQLHTVALKIDALK